MALLLFPPGAFADESQLVAVLPLHAVGDIPAVDKGSLDDVVRSEAARALSPAGFIVLTEDVQLQVLQDNGMSADQITKACEGSCPLAVAKELKARLFIAGVVTRESDGSMLGIIRFYDGKTGALAAATSAMEGPDIRTIREKFIAEAPAFFERGVRQAQSEIQFSAGVAVVVPSVVVSASGGMTSLNIAAEKLLEQAMDAQEDKKAQPEAKADAWCKLSALTDRNPYLEKATEACRAWNTFATNLRRAEASMPIDYETLTQYLKLKRTTREQRLAAADAFLATYKALDTYPMVIEARKLRESIEQTGTGKLAAISSSTDADGDGISDADDLCPLEPGNSIWHGCPARYPGPHHFVLRVGFDPMSAGVLGVGAEYQWRWFGVGLGTGTYAFSCGGTVRAPFVFYGSPYAEGFFAWSKSYVLHDIAPGAGVGGTVGYDWRFLPWLSIKTGLGLAYNSGRTWAPSASVPWVWDLSLGWVL